MSDEEPTLSVAELADYCDTQARLLAGRSETIAAETDELLDEIDEEIAEMRDRLPTRSDGPDTVTPSPDTPGTDTSAEVKALEQLGAELEEKQAVAKAKRERMALFQELSEAYADLAAELDASAVDGEDALEQIVQFEQEHDAPAYFDDQETLLEIVARSER